MITGDNIIENYYNLTLLCKQTADSEHCQTNAATTNETLQSKTDIYKVLHSTSKNKAEQNASHQKDLFDGAMDTASLYPAPPS